MGAADDVMGQGADSLLRFFGEAITHTPDGGSPESLTAIVNLTQARIDYVGDGEDDVTTGVIEVDIDDAGSITERSGFTIRSKSYGVESIDAQDHVMVVRVIGFDQVRVGGADKIQR